MYCGGKLVLSSNTLNLGLCMFGNNINFSSMLGLGKEKLYLSL